MKERFRSHLAFAGQLLVAQSLFAASTVQFTARVFTVAENVGQAVIPVVRTVERSDDLETPFFCEYYTIGGSATADEDFTPVNGFLDFDAGVTNQAIVVPILDDALSEHFERFRVVLTNVVGDAVIGGGTARISIQDDESEFEVSQPWRIPSYGSLEAMAISPDDRYLLTGGTLGVFLWDLASGEFLRSYPGFDGFVDALAFSPDGKQILAGGADVFVEGVPGEVVGGLLMTFSDWKAITRLWDFESAELLRTFEGAGRVGFSPDGRMVLTTDGKPCAYFWGALMSFSVTSYLSSGRGNYQLWDVETGELRHEFEGDFPAPYVPSDDSSNLVDRSVPFAFSPDSTEFLAIGKGSPAGTPVRRWDLSTGELRTIWLSDHSEPPFFVGFSPDGSQVITAGAELPSSIRWWDTRTGNLLRSVPAQFRDDPPPDPRGAMAVSPDGSRLLRVVGVKSGAPILELLDAETGRLLTQFKGHSGAGLVPRGILSLTFSSDAEKVVSAGGDQTVRLWDSASGNVERVFDGHNHWTDFIVFSCNGELVLSGAGCGVSCSPAQRAQLWQVRTGTLLRTFGNANQVVSAGAFSRDGSQVLIVGSYGPGTFFAELWDLDVGTREWAFAPRAAVIRSVDLSPEGQRVLIGCGVDENVSKLWSGPTQSLLRSFDGGAAAFFSPDGARVLTHTGPASDEASRLWDAESGELIHTFPGEPVPVGSSPFSADGQRLYMRTASGIEIWSVESGALQRTLSVSEGDGHFVALSPDEQWMLEVASDEETAWLRDVETGAIGRFLEHGLENRFATGGGEVSGKFSPDGRRVATWLGFHAARRYPRIWDISDLTLQISIQQDGAFLELSWSAGKLETADELGGPWTTLDEATSPHRVELNALRRFYRARKE